MAKKNGGNASGANTPAPKRNRAQKYRLNEIPRPRGDNVPDASEKPKTRSFEFFAPVDFADTRNRFFDRRLAALEDRRTDGRLGSSEDGQTDGRPGSSEDGQTDGRIGSSEDGQTDGRPGSSDEDGQTDGRLGMSATATSASARGRALIKMVKNGNGSPVTYIPAKFFNKTSWGNFGLGYVPDQVDNRDYLLNRDNDKEAFAKYLEKLRKSVENRKKYSKLETTARYASPFHVEPLQRAFELASAIRDEDDKKLRQAEKDIGRYRLKPNRSEWPGRVNFGDGHCLNAVENQGEIASCTAHAVIGLVEYLIAAGTGREADLSRLFLYKTTRDRMGVSGDTGAYIRSTIKAMAAAGVPAEGWWEYAPKFLECDPPAGAYNEARNMAKFSYRRLDSYGTEPKVVLALLLHVLSAGFPVVFGFPVYNTIKDAKKAPFVIPAPTPAAGHIGGHAVMAVGFDVAVPYARWNRRISDFEEKEGALIIKNSWGEGWGDKGFAYLPFSYITDALALDIWTIFSSDWIDEKYFKTD